MIMELLDDENDHNSQVEKLKEILFKEGDDGLDDILSKLQQQQETIASSKSSDKLFKSFLPEPGFCLKSKIISSSSSSNTVVGNDEQERKLFINICQSKEINSPKDISEAELMKLIDSSTGVGGEDRLDEAAFQFRIPMSLGEAHDELDNSGSPATVYDVCISPEFFTKINKIHRFMGFFMSVVFEGLESKYSIKIDRNCKMLKNRKFMGKIQEQYIRTKSKPLIAEVGENPTEIQPNLKVDEKVEKETQKAIVPKYKIVREPAEGKPEFLVAEIELPNILSSNSLTLDIGEDRILLSTRSNLYHLDIFLPFNLKAEECGAQFDRKTRVLTITMPVSN